MPPEAADLVRSINMGSTLCSTPPQSSSSSDSGLWESYFCTGNWPVMSARRAISRMPLVTLGCPSGPANSLDPNMPSLAAGLGSTPNPPGRAAKPGGMTLQNDGCRGFFVASHKPPARFRRCLRCGIPPRAGALRRHAARTSRLQSREPHSTDATQRRGKSMSGRIPADVRSYMLLSLSPH